MLPDNLPELRRGHPINSSFENSHGSQPEKIHPVPLRQQEALLLSLSQERAKEHHTGAEHSEGRKKAHKAKHGITPKQFMRQEGKMFVFYYIPTQKERGTPRIYKKSLFLNFSFFILESSSRIVYTKKRLWTLCAYGGLGEKMREWRLLIWLPQFGISVVFPLIGFIMLAVWLRDNWGWGQWVIWVGILFGLITAAVGVRDTIKAMALSDKKKDQESPPVSFNDHD